MRLRIRWKLLLGIGTPLVVLSALIVLGSFFSERAAALKRTEAQLTKDAQYFAARFDTQLEMLAQIARTTASFLSAHPDVSEPELFEMLRLNVAQSPLIYGSCVAFEPHTFSPERRLFAPYVYKGPSGTPRPGAPPPAGTRGPDGLLRMDVADAYDYTDPRWEWFSVPHAQRTPMWTEPFFDDGAGDVVMCTYVAPFFRDGKFRGTVNIDVRLEDLHAVVTRMQPGDATVSIISRKGAFIAWPDPALIMHDTVQGMAERLKRPDMAELGRRMTSRQTATERMLSLDAPQVPQLISYTPIPSTGWSFAASVNEGKAVEPVYAVLRYNALIVGSMIVIVVGVTLLVALWLTRPVEQLADAVARVKIDRRAVERGTVGTLPTVPARTRDEIGDLGRAFNTMVAQIHEQVHALTRETRAREAVESEVRIARDIQQSLLPRTFPPFPGRTDFDLYAFNGAAKTVAGDFYDFLLLPDGRLALVIADVCGKGVPAAMYMAVARTFLRNLIMTCSSTAAMLDELNRVLAQDNPQSLFVTLIVAIMEPKTGRVHYASGGHPRPLVRSAGGACRAFGRVTGTIVGVLEDQEWSEALEQLERGDTLVMFTDGVPDARRPGAPASEAFGDERLAEFLSALPEGLSAREITDRLIARLYDYATRDWPDDVTVLVLKRA